MNITIKNIPNGVHRALKERARQNKRSLNSEILSCLEAAVKPAKLDTDAFLDDVRQLRELSGADFDLDRVFEELERP
jgi:plasmid stability protein